MVGCIRIGEEGGEGRGGKGRDEMEGRRGRGRENRGKQK